VPEPSRFGVDRRRDHSVDLGRHRVLVPGRPGAQPPIFRQKNLDQVFFGATVTYAHERGTERTITIVGIDEADLDRGQASWISPIARALMKAHEGDILELRTPGGIEHIKVLDIRYASSDAD